MIKTLNVEIQSLVNDIRDGTLLLPELQRSFVWKSTQVRDLFDSLYNRYPSGQLLVWQTDDLPYSHTAHIGGLSAGHPQPQLLLDGQQRLTSLAGIMLGLPLHVRGSSQPIDIVFNVFTEKFDVAGPSQRGQYGWISLSKLFTQGEISALQDLELVDLKAPETQQILDRLKRVTHIRTYQYHVNILQDLPYDVVTHIFVRINSAGTRLSSADLALAQLSSKWRGVSEEFAEYQRHVSTRGLKIDTSILVRALSVLLTGQARLGRLFKGERQNITVDELQHVWNRVRAGLDQAISFLVNNCKIDNLTLLPTQYILLPLMAFFDRFGANVSTTEARALQRWVYMALIWSHFSGTTETAVEQDVAALSKDEPIQRMIQLIEDKAGRRPITEREFRDQLKNSPMMLMAYVLARHNNAQDWTSGVVVGPGQPLYFHHIFPKSILKQRYDLRGSVRLVDQVANLAVLAHSPGSELTKHTPAVSLANVSEDRLRAQRVPIDADLWEPERFEDFLLERRKLLAEGINQLLQSLTEGASLWPVSEAELMRERVGVLERRLRELVATRLEQAKGNQAWSLVPDEVASRLKGLIAARLKEHPYETGRYDTLVGKLSFCMFSDYGKIIEAHWSLFNDVFGKLSSFQQYQQYMNLVTGLRNAIAHGRETTASERALAEGALLWLEDCLNYAEQKSAVEEEGEAA